jgi:hypothetical protein
MTFLVTVQCVIPLFFSSRADRVLRAVKEHLKIVFIGHIDAGKSILGRNILFLSGTVDKHTMEKYEREAKEASRKMWYLSWALDSTPPGQLSSTSKLVAAFLLHPASRLVATQANPLMPSETNQANNGFQYPRDQAAPLPRPYQLRESLPWSLRTAPTRLRYADPRLASRSAAVVFTPAKPAGAGASGGTRDARLAHAEDHTRLGTSPRRGCAQAGVPVRLGTFLLLGRRCWCARGNASFSVQVYRGPGRGAVRERCHSCTAPTVSLPDIFEWHH